MDWLELQKTLPVPNGVSARTGNLLRLAAVLDGHQYDEIQYPFSTEYTPAGEYVPLAKRRPSVKTHIIRTVIDDLVALIFGDTHFPSVRCDDADTLEALTAFIRCANIESLMQEAATRGSLGSVALLVEAKEYRPVVTVLDTAYLSPVWDDVTGTLTSVTERFQVPGEALRQRGYEIADDDLSSLFWWQRIWDEERVEVYSPVRVGDESAPVVDENRTTLHGLKFVPIVWVRTTAGCPTTNEPDGPCLFERAIDNQIEADYVLSQAGRGLKYSADPKLVIRDEQIVEPGAPGSIGSNQSPARVVGGAASALELSPQGDAKLLEISGTSSTALIEYEKAIRNVIIEQLHGNRADPDRLSAAQSGRAMEMMCVSLTWFASRLREPFGNGALLALLRMVCAFSSEIEGGIEIDGERYASLDCAGLTLLWPKWFPPTAPEMLQMAQALVTAVDGSVMSNETACTLWCSFAGVDDSHDEWRRVQAELANSQLQQARTQGVTKAADTRKAATDGKTLSHQVQA